MTTRYEATMGTVVVALEQGFAGHHVRVRIDGDVVVDATNVTTDPVSGLAGSVAAEIGPRCRVDVEVPELDVAETRDVEIAEFGFLRVSLADGRLLVSLEREGPRYI